VGIVESLFSLARVAFLQGDLAQVPPPLEESLALAREVGDKLGLASSLNLLGEIILCQSDATRARSLLEESLALFKGAGFRRGMNLSLTLLAKVEAQQGDHVSARALYEQSLVIAREMNNKLNIVDCLEGLAGVVAAQGELTWGARLWGAAEALRDAMGTPIPPVYRVDSERPVTAARTQLGEKVFAEAWAEGRAMTPEQVLAVQIPGTKPISESSSTLPTKSTPTYPAGLTSREVEVLRLVAQGLTDAQVAEQLVISPRTVNTHLTSIYGKIGASTRSAATRYALEHRFT
jgi:DNA-binding CsgD family transcriptional regulator